MQDHIDVNANIGGNFDKGHPYSTSSRVHSKKYLTHRKLLNFIKKRGISVTSYTKRKCRISYKKKLLTQCLRGDKIWVQ